MVLILYFPISLPLDESGEVDLGGATYLLVLLFKKYSRHTNPNRIIRC